MGCEIGKQQAGWALPTINDDQGHHQRRFEKIELLLKPPFCFAAKDKKSSAPFPGRRLKPPGSANLPPIK
jgi:hypothetical protein